MKCTRAVPFDTVSPSLNMIFSTVPARGARITYCEKEWKNRKHLKAYAPEVSFHRNDLRHIPHPPTHTHTHTHACMHMSDAPNSSHHFTHTHAQTHTHTHKCSHTYTHIHGCTQAMLPIPAIISHTHTCTDTHTHTHTHTNVHTHTNSHIPHTTPMQMHTHESKNTDTKNEREKIHREIYLYKRKLWNDGRQTATQIIIILHTSIFMAIMTTSGSPCSTVAPSLINTRSTTPGIGATGSSRDPIPVVDCRYSGRGILSVPLPS